MPYTISVALPKIFKHIDHLGMFSEIFDEELYAIKNKHFLIEKLICSYVKKYFAVCNSESDEYTAREIKHPNQNSQKELVNNELKLVKRRKINNNLIKSVKSPLGQTVNS